MEKMQALGNRPRTRRTEVLRSDHPDHMQSRRGWNL